MLNGDILTPPLIRELPRRHQMLNGDIWPYANLFHNFSGSNDYDNFMNTDAPAALDYYAAYLERPDVRAALHVGDAPFQDGSDCEMHLVSDFMVSFAPETSMLMEIVLWQKQ